jgi:hypothetical protein
MRNNLKIEATAHRFFLQLMPSENWDGTDHPTKPLIRAAFRLYAEAWEGTPGFDITDWKWPFTTLAKGEPFVGDRPWSVLLHRAVDLAAAANARNAPSIESVAGGEAHSTEAPLGRGRGDGGMSGV